MKELNELVVEKLIAQGRLINKLERALGRKNKKINRLRQAVKDLEETVKLAPKMAGLDDVVCYQDPSHEGCCG